MYNAKWEDKGRRVAGLGTVSFSGDICLTWMRNRVCGDDKSMTNESNKNGFL